MSPFHCPSLPLLLPPHPHPHPSAYAQSATHPTYPWLIFLDLDALLCNSEQKESGWTVNEGKVTTPLKKGVAVEEVDLKASVCWRRPAQVLKLLAKVGSMVGEGREGRGYLKVSCRDACRLTCAGISAHCALSLGSFLHGDSLSE